MLFTMPLCALAGSADASEGSGSFNLGIRDVLAGKLPAPGFYIRYDFDYYQGSLDNIVTSAATRTDIDLITRISMLRLYHVTGLEILGGQHAWSILAPYADMEASAAVRGVKGAPLGTTHYSTGGKGDMLVTPLALGWHFDKLHYMFTASAYVPTGDYSSKSAVKIGKNRYAFDPAFAMTYLDTETMRELSTAIGYTISSANTDTDYRNGDEIHMDLAMVQRFNSGIGVGAVGYALEQVTGDSGAGAKYGGNKGQVFALGPMVTFTGKINEKNFHLAGKYYREFGAVNKYEGGSFWLSMVMGL